MAMDEQHIALPKLYGAPEYGRPPRNIEVTPSPFDPDDLPIEAVMTDEEREVASKLPAHAFAPGGTHGREALADGGEPRLDPRPLSLKALAGRVLGRNEN